MAWKRESVGGHEVRLPDAPARPTELRGCRTESRQFGRRRRAARAPGTAATRPAGSRPARGPGRVSTLPPQNPASAPPGGPLTAGSLCSGYGGLDLAVMAVTGARLAWCAETDRYAAGVLAHHWPGVPNLGDVTALDWAAMPPVDLVSAGWPCQDISYAGPGGAPRAAARRAGTVRPAPAVGRVRRVDDRPRPWVRDRGSRHPPHPPAEDHRQRRRPPAGRRRAPAADRSRRPGFP
jgi:hypothetical protein